MARKRERWLNMAWIHWLHGDTGEGSVGPCPYALAPIGEYMPTLVGVYRRYVEAEKEGDAYILRVIPREPDREDGGMSIGLAYRGTDLNEMFRQAVWDLDRLNRGVAPYRVGRSEWQRWVP